VSVSLERLGNLALAEGNLPEARRLFSDALAVAQRLSESDPGNASWQRDLVVSYFKLGGLEEQSGNGAAAKSNFLKCLAVLRGMKQSHMHFDSGLAAAHKKLSDRFDA
ncbi:MAG: tetratricopeptide repeat protein, partial [Planctomycetota bacterium]